jgi:hypothetical protein
VFNLRCLFVLPSARRFLKLFFPSGSQAKDSPRTARNIRSDREAFAANFVVDWNVPGDKWQSPHWCEKIAQTPAKLQRFIHCHCLHSFCRCRLVKVPRDWREIFAAVATTTFSPKFRADCDKDIRVVIQTNATVLW